MKLYTLGGDSRREVISCPSVGVWNEWMAANQHHLLIGYVHLPLYWVVTRFHGINLSNNPDEVLPFRAEFRYNFGPQYSTCFNLPTWKQALDAHADLVNALRKACNG